MSDVVMFITFKLVKGASVPDFLLAAERLHTGFMAGQAGYVSWKQLVECETWADVLTWKTADDARRADEAGCADPLAHAYYAFIDQESMKVNFFSIAKDYEAGR